jgi:hypothetical protein
MIAHMMAARGLLLSQASLAGPNAMQRLQGLEMDSVIVDTLGGLGTVDGFLGVIGMLEGMLGGFGIGMGSQPGSTSGGGAGWTYGDDRHRRHQATGRYVDHAPSQTTTSAGTAGQNDPDSQSLVDPGLTGGPSPGPGPVTWGLDGIGGLSVGELTALVDLAL